LGEEPWLMPGNKAQKRIVVSAAFFFAIYLFDFPVVPSIFRPFGFSVVFFSRSVVYPLLPSLKKGSGFLGRCRDP